MQFTVATATIMRKVGGAIARSCIPGSVIYLQGELGTGKTTLVRGFLRGLGFKGHVRSPTFNLLEIYQVNHQIICHFDLYRLKHSEELLYIGITDFFNGKNICLIEWPENGKGILPTADLLCNFSFINKGRGRSIEIIANSPEGKLVIKKCKF